MLDNHSTHKTDTVRRWLALHRAFTCTSPHASWFNLAERSFGELTSKKPYRGTHRSPQQLNADTRRLIEH